MIHTNRRGMTLTEVAFTMAIFSYFAIVTLSAVSAFHKMNSRDIYEKQLLNQARIVMEKVVWGPGMKNSVERDGIGEAVSYQIAGNTFRYTLPDGVSRSIVQSQDELTFHKAAKQTTLYDPNGVNTPPEPQKYSTTLTFTQLALSVLQVDLVLGKKEGGKWHYASLSTAVSLRN